ncbi:hypothetical protein B5F40_01855 [Gordonibacter sp. An230]|nr:hypothetical protein B5F40_01855 [Gordonibacter sp. An230]
MSGNGDGRSPPREKEELARSEPLLVGFRAPKRFLGLAAASASPGAPVPIAAPPHPERREPDPRSRSAFATARRSDAG